MARISLDDGKTWTDLPAGAVVRMDDMRHYATNESFRVTVNDEGVAVLQNGKRNYKYGGALLDFRAFLGWTGK